MPRSLEIVTLSSHSTLGFDSIERYCEMHCGLLHHMQSLGIVHHRSLSVVAAVVVVVLVAPHK